MAELKEKIQDGLDENRLLVLGAQVLLGLQFRAAFETGFEQLPELWRVLEMAGLWLLVACFGLLLTPSAYHRIVENGEDSHELLAFMGRLMKPALLLLAVALSIDFFIAGSKVLRTRAGLVLALGVLAVAMFFLQGLEEAVQWRRRGARTPQGQAMSQSQKERPSSISDKIRHVLTEARLVIPGAQALLGFQFVIILTESFDRLPEISKLLHLASFGCVAVSVILLLSPAAYHRIVENGEPTEQMHRFASAMVLGATLPLGLGIAGDVYVVTQMVLKSPRSAALAAAGALALMYGLWFGLTLTVRWFRRMRSGPGQTSGSEDRRRSAQT